MQGQLSTFTLGHAVYGKSYKNKICTICTTRVLDHSCRGHVVSGHIEVIDHGYISQRMLLLEFRQSDVHLLGDKNIMKVKEEKVYIITVN